VRWTPCLVALLLPSLAAAQAKPDLPKVESLVVDGTNEFRRHEGQRKLAPNETLDKAARAFAGYLAMTQEFGHEADGSTPAARARLHGYDYCLVSENISYQYSNAGFQTADLARKLVDGWKNSPGHRRNMLEADVVHTAVAVAHSPAKGVQKYYAVQMFGRPRSESVEFQVANLTRDPVNYRVAERAFVLQPRTSRTHTECGSQELVIDLPDARAPRFTTQKGDKFEVARDKGQLAVTRR
jgi:uncharacterized protein YkwD